MEIRGFSLLGLALVTVALLKLHSDREKPGSTVVHSRDPLKAKLAFLFLARHVMPLDILWEHFFEESRRGDFNIYIHARPGFVYTPQNTKCQAFVNRQLGSSIQVLWGEPSMIEAERLLLTESLKDPLNERFFLLSDSCIPLYSFDYVYNYVMASPKSFLDSFVDNSDEQYNSMESVIPPGRWRKGSQWFALIRKHAEAIVEDSEVYPVFIQHCKKSVPVLKNVTDEALKVGAKRPHSCIPDEHYIQTMFAMEELEDETERRTLTYSRWENQVAGKGRAGWHPATYTFSEATLDAVKTVQRIRSIRYETESRTEWCKVAGKDRPCFLFARKFTRAAGFRLLDQVSSYENGEPS